MWYTNPQCIRRKQVLPRDRMFENQGNCPLSQSGEIILRPLRDYADRPAHDSKRSLSSECERFTF